VSSPAGTGSTNGAPLRVLLVTTRDIGRRATGRIAVLRTHANALAALGHELALVIVTPDVPAESEWVQRFHTTHVRPPRLASVALSALRSVTLGGRSLNECLFVDRSVRTALARLISTVDPDVVVLDTLRLYSAVADVGVPVVVDLDDLLSVRYARLRTTAGSDALGVLGFAAARVPGPLRALVARGVVRLLGWESRRVAARELTVCAEAAAVSLVSRREADQLQQAAGRPVAWLPPAVPIPAQPVDQQDGLVFLGGLDYLPNVLALRFYRDEVLPHLDPADPRHVLHVVGHCPDGAGAEFDVPGMVLHGYADDLRQALSRRALVAPLLDGGGLKLKVLDAMAHGLPVVGTPQAFEGLDLPAEFSLRGGTGAELAQLLRDLVSDVDRCRRLGLAGRDLVQKSFSDRAATERWARLLHPLVHGGGAQAASGRPE
jgi:hypothetical protein